MSQRSSTFAVPCELYVLPPASSTETRGSCPSKQSTELTILNLQEVARITDQRVEFSLRSADAAAGKWLQEDPPLSTVQRISGSE
jgi:hypothetical protein